MDGKTILLTLVEFNNWANERTLGQLEQLDGSVLHRPADLSFGSAFHLVRHLLVTEWSWRIFATGGAGDKYLWEVEDLPDLSAVRSYWRDERVCWLEYIQSLSGEELERKVDFGTAQGGAQRLATVWQIVAHIVNHGTHHRSELARFLEYRGHPLGEAWTLQASWPRKKPEGQRPGAC